MRISIGGMNEKIKNPPIIRNVVFSWMSSLPVKAKFLTFGGSFMKSCKFEFSFFDFGVCVR